MPNYASFVHPSCSDATNISFAIISLVKATQKQRATVEISLLLRMVSLEVM